MITGPVWSCYVLFMLAQCLIWYIIVFRKIHNFGSKPKDSSKVSGLPPPPALVTRVYQSHIAKQRCAAPVLHSTQRPRALHVVKRDFLRNSSCLSDARGTTEAKTPHIVKLSGVWGLGSKFTLNWNLFNWHDMGRNKGWTSSWFVTNMVNCQLTALLLVRMTLANPANYHAALKIPTIWQHL